MKPDSIISYIERLDSINLQPMYGEEHIFYKDSIFYRGEDTINSKEIHLKYSSKGKLKNKAYYGYIENSKYLRPLTEFYYDEKGRVLEYVYYFPEKDSIIYDKDTVRCSELHIIYDKKGNIVEKVCQGTVKNEDVNTGMSVGTSYHYKDNKLIKELYFHNAKRGNDYILHKIYDDKGRYKEIYTNNYMLYENDSIVLSPKEIKRRTKTKKR
ncbi:hypothetical protein RCZ15_22390 [Capnocytophaga catalasegens]|uniref:Uncharacterized protein n=1 Tax=Capnocytophaga catalasegens TaxID=1004260 RepID=A0AAV5AVI1_9FLAO|nr:hypothetical protein RCZ03_20280 [Capnocytophaga catalasegens]GJM51266.1 hypothetical protein RCZ15_22390 [Capnocytophaga catalasegens]GJM53348.1 hypothetical protein RCZ16_16650 [Capnocytophaga catalasegens]